MLSDVLSPRRIWNEAVGNLFLTALLRGPAPNVKSRAVTARFERYRPQSCLDESLLPVETRTRQKRSQTLQTRFTKGAGETGFFFAGSLTPNCRQLAKDNPRKEAPYRIRSKSNFDWKCPSVWMFADVVRVRVFDPIFYPLQDLQPFTHIYTHGQEPPICHRIFTAIYTRLQVISNSNLSAPATKIPDFC